MGKVRKLTFTLLAAAIGVGMLFAFSKNKNVEAEGDWSNAPWGIYYNSGNVGLGSVDSTSSVDRLLTLVAPNQNRAILKFSEQNSLPFWQIVKTPVGDTLGSNSLGFNYTDAAGNFKMAMLISEQSNIGIGNKNPQAKVHINQDNSYGLIIEDTNGPLNQRTFRINSNQGQLKFQALDESYNLNRSMLKLFHNGDVCIGNC